MVGSYGKISSTEQRSELQNILSRCNVIICWDCSQRRYSCGACSYYWIKSYV